MVKTSFKLITLILPVMLVIGLLRRLFGTQDFLPSIESLMLQFNKFPSMKDEVDSLVNWSKGLSTYSSAAFDSIGVLWNNIESVGDFFKALGLTVPRFFQGIGSFIASIMGLIAIVPAILSYPIQAIVWLLGILTFAPA